MITVLKAVAIGWTEESLAENAREIAELGKELHKRVGVFIEHFATVGTRLDSAVRAFDDATGSLERNLLPQARRFTDLKVGSDKELAITKIGRSPRKLQAPEAENPEDEEHVRSNGNLK